MKFNNSRDLFEDVNAIVLSNHRRVAKLNESYTKLSENYRHMLALGKGGKLRRALALRKMEKMEQEIFERNQESEKLMTVLQESYLF